MSRPVHPSSDRSRTHRLRWFALLASAAVVLAACGGDDGDGDAGVDAGANATTAPPSTSDTADASDLPDQSFELADGSTATIADFVGRPLVVNFFASWCPPCRAEMPDFEEVHAAVRDDVTFLGFAVQDRGGAAESLVDDTGVTYQWANDPDGAIFTGFGGFSMPTTVYISADGEVLERDNGAISRSHLVDRVERLFDVTVP
ncbi:MAG: TlpA disulfide reductase family protein [Ilumatobacteraceae bacterium]